MHWAQQLLALIKKGETQQLSARDSQFCCPQPGLPEARLTPPRSASPGREAGYPLGPWDPAAGQGYARKRTCATSTPIVCVPTVRLCNKLRNVTSACGCICI